MQFLKGPVNGDTPIVFQKSHNDIIDFVSLD